MGKEKTKAKASGKGIVSLKEGELDEVAGGNFRVEIDGVAAGHVTAPTKPSKKAT